MRQDDGASSPTVGLGRAGTDFAHPSVAAARTILDSPVNPKIAALIRYWLDIHPGRALPSRDDFDPIDVPTLLPHLVLTRVEAGGSRFLVRLMGTAVVLAFGTDYTGYHLDETVPNFTETLSYKLRARVVESGLPAYRQGEATIPFRLDFAPVEQVHLPFAGDGETVDLILSMTIYPPQERQDP